MLEEDRELASPWLLDYGNSKVHTVTGTPTPRLTAKDFPAELQELNQWVLWKSLARGGNETKVPWSVFNSPASTNDPRTWSSFDTVVSTYD